MAIQPFFASRDPSIAQSIYNLGNAFLGPDARRRDAADAMDARVADAKVRNLDADTGFTGSRTLGQNFTNTTRQAAKAAAYKVAIARGATPEQAELESTYAAMSENPDLNSRATYRTSGQEQKDELGRIDLTQRFAGQRNTEDNNTRVKIAGMEGDNRYRVAELDNKTKADIAARTPVVASDGSTVFFAEGDGRLPVPRVAPAERPAPTISNPGLPPAVPPPATLGTAFVNPPQAAAQPQAPAGPVVEGNTVRIPANPSARQGNEVADEAKRVALFKSQTDAWNDIGAALASRLEAGGYDMDAEVKRGLVDAAMGIAAQNGFRINANQALDAAMSQLSLAPVTQDGWLWDTTTMGRNGAEIDNAALLAEIQRRWGNPAMANTGAPAAPAPAPTPSIVPPTQPAQPAAPAAPAAAVQPAAPTQPARNYPTPPAAAVQLLRQNPSLAPRFDEKYGPGAAAAALR